MRGNATTAAITRRIDPNDHLGSNTVGLARRRHRGALDGWQLQGSSQHQVSGIRFRWCAAGRRRLAGSVARFAQAARDIGFVIAATLSVSLGTVNPSESAERAAAAPPNVVLILADDAGVETIGAYGGERPTPRIDALAREGVRFENAHATPLCTPSRVRLLTGRYSFRNYKAFGHLGPAEPSLAKVLRKANYRTAVAGKWQLSGNPLDGVPGSMPSEAGFDESRVWAGGRNFLEDGCQYWAPTLDTNGQRRTYPGEFGPDLVHDWALQFLERHRDRPFFLYYSMILPHDPWVATPARPDAQSKDQKFDAMIAYMDSQVGELLDRIDRLALRERTIVVFVADNGTNQQIASRRGGTQVVGGKSTTLATATHVPLLLRWPARIPKPQVSGQMVDLTDLYATLAAAAGDGAAAAASDGFDLVPSLVGGKAPRREAIFMDYAGEWWPLDTVKYVFDARWKLYHDGRFYDLAADPFEETPLTLASLGRDAQHAHERLTVELARIKAPVLRIDDRHFPRGFDPAAIDYNAVRLKLQERLKTCADPARMASDAR